MKNLCLIFMLLICHKSFAQKEANNWVFGCAKAMSFNSGTPMMISKSVMGDTYHSGGSVMSNAKGRMIFYIAHTQVFDSTETAMPNGSFLGNGRTIQSSIIVPWPDSAHLFIVFSPGCSNNDFFRYSVINMKLRNGLGDIDVNRKNIALPTFSSGKVTAVHHASRRGYWVLTPQGNSDTMHAYLITSNGVATTPVKSYTGIFVKGGPTFLDDYYGYFKLSPNGRKVCNINRNKQSMIADFDPSTGKLSNVWDFNNNDLGIEFSARNKFLYMVTNANVLSQYDLSAKTKSAFLKSKKTIDSANDYSFQFASLQLAPNGKIYIYNGMSEYLHTIQAPDSAGKLCRFKKNDFWVTSGTTNNYHYGLPNFVQSLFHKPSFEVRQLCSRDTVFFKIAETYAMDSALWDFDDPGSGKMNISRATNNVFHIYKTQGITYNPRLICYYKNFSDTIIEPFFVNYAKPDLGRDTTICLGNYIGLYNRRGIFKSYKWSNGQSLLGIFAGPGKHRLTVTDIDGCLSSDTIEVKGTTIKSDFSVSDTAHCFKGNSFLLTETTQYGGQIPHLGEWYINDSLCAKDSVLTLEFKSPGKYIIKLVSSTQGFCLDSTTKIITVWPDPMAAFSINDSAQCFYGHRFDFTNQSGISSGNLRYDWDLGDLKTFQTDFINKTFKKHGLYKIALIAISDNACRDTAARNIHVYDSSKSDFTWSSNCSDLPTQFTFTGIKPDAPVITNLLWDFDGEGSSNVDKPSFLFKGAGKKKVKLITITDQGCADTAVYDIEIKLKAKADFKANDVCETDSVVFTNQSTDASGYKWKFGDGLNSLQTSPTHLYKIGGISNTFNVTLVAVSGCSDSITQAVTVNANPVSDFSYTKTGTKLDLKASQINQSKYIWKFGSNDSVITTNSTHIQTLTKSEQYKVCLRVINIAGCFSETCKDVTLGIATPNEQNGFKLYSNPNIGNFTIEIENPQKNISIEVYDLIGNLVKSVETSPNKWSYDINLNMADGIYLVRVTNGEVVFNQKVIIQK